ncbi:MAG: lipoate--protein ligase family protein [Opitutaceae bacterium]
MLVTLPNAFGDAATNMAIDAALLGTLPPGVATLRHYGWIEPAITFGYTQKYTDVKATCSDDPATLCRRLTGGGIVDHRNDWTYSIVLQNELTAARIQANELYTTVHQSIQSALTQEAIETQLAPCPRKCGEAPTQPSAHASECFVTPAASDVLLPSGQKVAGAAMKRTRQGLLIQGSLDRATLPDSFNYERFKSAFINALSASLAITQGSVEDLRTLFDSERIQQERLRFESSDWLQKR